MEEPLTECIEQHYPLYAFYRRHGVKVIHWWAAVAGCDVTELSNGVDGIGKEMMFKTFCSLSGEGGEVTEEQFAAMLLCLSPPPSVSLKYSVAFIAEELKCVGSWYTKCGLFYDLDLDGNIFRIDGERIEPVSNRSWQHMKGRLHPKTSAVFSEADMKQLKQIEPANLLHNSKADRSMIADINMPTFESHTQGPSQKSRHRTSCDELLHFEAHTTA
eukprot:scaffold93977_cov62-Attheya_sp.AAC.2